MERTTALALYERLVATHSDVDRKGAMMPYTSVNGHMFSVLTKDNKLALRLPEDARSAFLKRYKTTLCEQYGHVMPEYVIVPDSVAEENQRVEAILRRELHLRRRFEAEGDDQDGAWIDDEEVGAAPPPAIMTDVRPVDPGDRAEWLRMRTDLWPGDEGTGPCRRHRDVFCRRNLLSPLQVLIAVDDTGARLGFAELAIRGHVDGCDTDRVAFLEGCMPKLSAGNAVSVGR